MAARPILETFPGVWYTTAEDGSVIISASANYHDRFDGEWSELPPMSMENGLVVHWMIKPQWSIPSESEVRTFDGLTPNRFRELRRQRMMRSLWNCVKAGDGM